MVVVRGVGHDRERDVTPDLHIVGGIVAVGTVILGVDRGLEGDPFPVAEIHDRLIDRHTIGRTLDVRIHRHQHRHRFVENQENRLVLLRQRHRLRQNRLHPTLQNRVVEVR